MRGQAYAVVLDVATAGDGEELEGLEELLDVDDGALEYEVVI